MTHLVLNKSDKNFEEFLFLYGESKLRLISSTIKKDMDDLLIVWVTKDQVGCKSSSGEMIVIPMRKVINFYEVDFLPFADLSKFMYLNNMLISTITGVDPKNRVQPIVEIMKYLIKTSNDHILMDVFRDDINHYFKDVNIQYEDDEDLISPYFTLSNEHFIITCYKTNYEIEIQILGGVDQTITNLNLIQYHRLLILFGVNLFSDYE